MVSFFYVFIFSSTCKVANAIGEPFDCDLFWHNPFDYRNHAQDIVYKKKNVNKQKVVARTLRCERNQEKRCFLKLIFF